MAEKPANLSAPGVIEWPEEPDVTFQQALATGSQVFQRLVGPGVLPSLPHRDPKRHYPATMSDALAIVHARDDAKKKSAANKARHKSIGTAQAATQAHFPGAVEGGGESESAFWLYMEDHFRDVTQEDVHTILGLCTSLEDDPALHMLPTGSGIPNLLKPAGKGGAATPVPASAEQQPLPPRAASLKQQPKEEDIKPILDQPMSPTEGRRSVRLVVRANRMEGMYNVDGDDDDDDFSLQADLQHHFANQTPKTTMPSGPGTSNTVTGGNTAGPAQPALPVMTLPTTATGAPVSSLFQVVPDAALALLAKEIQALQDLAGVTTTTAPSIDPALITSVSTAAAQQDGVISSPNQQGFSVAAEQRSTLETSLVALTSDLAKTMGTEQRLKLLVPHESEEEHQVGPPEGFSMPSAAYLHPYTKLLLKKPVPEHLKVLAKDPSLAPVDANSRPATAPGRTPSVQALGALQQSTKSGATPGASTPAVLAAAAGTSGMTRPASSGALSDGGLLAATNAAATPSAPASSMPASSMDTEEGGRDDQQEASGGVEQQQTGGASRLTGRQRAVSNYALMVGKKDPVKAAAASAARKLQRAATAAKEAEVAQQHPVALAVGDMIAAGVKQVDADERWEGVTSATEVIAAAPQDELAAEILALQSELMSVAIANRLKLKQAVAAMLEDLPRQEQRRAEKEQEEYDVKEWVENVREAKKAEQRLRREAAQREAQARKGANLLSSPRPVLGRQQGVYNEQDLVEDGSVIEAPFLGPEELYDVLAQRDMNDEAFCAVCGEGHSEPPNLILYCDRCDVAVHQRCYDVPTVPEHEWLCWPCQEYEAEQRAAGVPQSQIRPAHSLSLDRQPLEGGARSVKCALCPIKCGAFRKTVNGQKWVHQACALWHAETYVADGIGAAVVAGLENVPSKRWTTPCDICGLADGAVVSCRHPGTCQYAFHVLCARNCGLYLTVRADKQTHKPQYRAYCAIHSKAQRDKDMRASEARAAGQVRAAAVSQEMVKREEKMANLAIKESERQHLSLIRINFESCRVLVDLCKRRERLKKQLSVLKQQTYLERVQDPAAALGFIARAQELQASGLPHQQVMDALFNPESIAFQQQQQQQQKGILMDFPPFEVPATLDEGEAALTGGEGSYKEQTPGGGSAALQGPASMQIDSFGGIAAGPLTTGDGEPGTGIGTRRSSRYSKRGRDNEGALSADPSSSSLLSLGVGPSSKKAKTTPAVSAGANAPPSLPPAYGKGPSKEELALVERQKVLSSSEAAQLNKKLPSGLRYVPIDKLPSTLADKAGQQQEQEEEQTPVGKQATEEPQQQQQVQGGGEGHKPAGEDAKAPTGSVGRSTRASARLQGGKD